MVSMVATEAATLKAIMVVVPLTRAASKVTEAMVSGH